MLNITKFEFNPFPVNTYLAWDDLSKEAILFDAGCYTIAEQQRLTAFISQNDIKIKYLLATHLHLDHNFGSAFASRTFNVPLEAHEADEFLLEGMEAQASMFGMQLPEPPIPIGRYVQEGDTFTIGTYTFRAIHVPGHSPGSIVYYCAKESLAIVGDVLFRGSIGRTDLPGGNYKTLIKNIQEKLLALPDQTVIYSGHGPETSIGNERTYNPYL